MLSRLQYCRGGSTGHRTVQHSPCVVSRSPRGERWVVGVEALSSWFVMLLPPSLRLLAARHNGADKIILYWTVNRWATRCRFSLRASHWHLHSRPSILHDGLGLTAVTYILSLLLRLHPNYAVCSHLLGHGFTLNI